MKDFKTILFGNLVATCITLALTAMACNAEVQTPPTIPVPGITREPQPIPLPRYTIEELMGKIVPASDSSFVPVPKNMITKDQIFLRREAYSAFQKMDSAAKAEGVILRIVSGTRTFGEQKGIWEAKWNGDKLVEGKNLKSEIPDPPGRAKKILQYSSMPGTSRHHWGTDIDLNNLNNSWFESGQGKILYDWLRDNAIRFGFCQVYSAKDRSRPEGYEEEKWHWSYLPLANQMLVEYKLMVTDEEISGFQGSETAVQLKIVKNYVSGINPACGDEQKSDEQEKNHK